MAKLLGEYKDGVASEDVLAILRKRHTFHGQPGHKVAVYQNHALDSSSPGHLVFLLVGPGRVFVEAPPTAPDGPWGVGWKYLYVGHLDLETNQLESTDG